MFGNPGTVEQGFLDALAEYPQMKYILTLQESVAVMMADGFARANKRAALVQLHSTPGVGNAIGALYQAMRGHAPLVVIGGDAGKKYASMDAQMAGDLIGFVEPVTKWSAIAMDASSVLRLLRRAIKIASTPPMGPVYLCLPMDVLDSLSIEEVYPTSIPSTRTIPDAALISQAAGWLARAQNPVIFMGDGVAYSGAHEELSAIAETLGCEVWGVDSGELNMAYDHPLYQGQTGHMFGQSSLPTMRKADVNLICGTYILPEVFPEVGEVFAPGAKKIHIDLNAYEIAKNHPVDLGMVSDPKLTLAALNEELRKIMTPEQKRAAGERKTSFAEKKAEAHKSDLERDADVRDSVPLKFSRFMEELARLAPEDTIIFDEALTSSPALTRYMPPKKPGGFFQTRGGSLGVGIPGSLGVKLANPDKTVIGFTGDGGSMYTIQAIWSASRHNIGAKFVICNNSSYRLLQLNIQTYWKERSIKEHDFPLCFDLSRPAIRFDEMSRAMGVEAVRVEKPREIEPAIRRMLSDDRPFLIDLVLESETHPDLIGKVCNYGQ